MMKLIRFALLSLAFLLSGTAFGQSNLPACTGSDVSRWSNCFGSYTTSTGDKYVGEFKNGKYNGQGAYYYLRDNEWKGSKYVGDFIDNKRNGQGTFVWASGDKIVGEYKDDIPNGQVTYYFLADNQWKGDKYVGEYKGSGKEGEGTYFRADGRIGLGEWIDNRPDGRFIEYRADKTVERSGIFKAGNLVTSQYIDPNSFTRIARNNSAPAVSDSQRQAIEQRERQVAIEAERLAEEKRRLDAQKIKIEEEKKSSRIAIKGNVTQPDANGDFTITISTGADTASLKIDGDELGGKRDGNYVIKRVARVGDENTYKITARDVFGNTDSATVTVARQVADSRPAIPRLNPANVRVQQSRDAVAIIIGIENYRRVAKADFANADAKEFYTYASRALGIKPENIKLLVDDGADDIEMLNAFQNWLPLKVNKGKTDVYVFYSGHGFPGQDGKSLYFLPFNVDKQYLDRTSVKQKEIVAALQKAQAKSVTMFIDACYSGQTRNGEVLVAGIKPVFITTEERAYPPEFTVITASAADQFSSASQDLKHGIFSFYLMKALEGDADENKDGRITSGELQRYLSDMVGRQAMGLNRTQNTQLFGDADRVLVGR